MKLITIDQLQVQTTLMTLRPLVQNQGQQTFAKNEFWSDSNVLLMVLQLLQNMTKKSKVRVITSPNGQNRRRHP